MRIEDPRIVAALPALAVELHRGASLAELTSLRIGSKTDMLRVKKQETIPELLNLLDANQVPHKFLGGGSNLLVADGELPWVSQKWCSKAISPTWMQPPIWVARLPSVQKTILAVWRV
jgi:hypothetical protein